MLKQWKGIHTSHKSEASRHAGEDAIIVASMYGIHMAWSPYEKRILN